MSIPDDEFLRKFIQQDSQDHPECRYSTSTSKNCGSYNGKYSCETIRRVFKRCPNVPPEKIYEKTTTDTGSYDPSTGSGGVLGGGNDPKHPGIDPFARRPPGFPFAPPDIDAVFSQASEDIIAKMEKRLNKYWSDKLPVSKSTNGTTPDLPAPHKPSHSKPDASDLEQG